MFFSENQALGRKFLTNNSRFQALKSTFYLFPDPETDLKNYLYFVRH